MAELIFKDEVYAIVGAAMGVHREKSCGFAEPVYQECTEIELADRKIPALAQKEMPISYKGRPLKKTYIADFVAYEKIICRTEGAGQIDFARGIPSHQLSEILRYGSRRSD